MNKTFPAAKQNCPASLFMRLLLDKRHLGLLSSNQDNLAIRRTVLLVFHKWPGILRCYQLYLTAKPGHLTYLVVSATTGLHHYGRKRLTSHKIAEFCARNFLTKPHAPLHLFTVDLEHKLCQIHSYHSVLQNGCRPCGALAQAKLSRHIMMPFGESTTTPW